MTTPLTMRPPTIDPNLGLNFGGQPLSLDQICLYLQRGGILKAVITEIQNQHLIHQALIHQAIQVEPAEVKMGMIQWRLQHQLAEPEAFQTWLQESGIDRPELIDLITHQLRVEKLQAQIAAPHLHQAYINQKLTLDQILLSRIVVPDRSQAEELLTQIIEDDQSFTELAQTHSVIADSGPLTCSRGQLPDAIRSLLDPAQPGQILGPIPLEGVWYLLRLEAIQPMSLAEAEPQLTAALFANWLQAQRPSPTGAAHVRH